MKPYRSIDIHLDDTTIYELIPAGNQYLIVATGLGSGCSTLAFNGASSREAGLRWRECCGGECMVSMAEIAAAGGEAPEAS